LNPLRYLTDPEFSDGSSAADATHDAGPRYPIEADGNLDIVSGLR
jgi:hypothetical protein